MFGNAKETKEEKEARKTNEVMQRYGLNDVDEKYKDHVKSISNALAGSGLLGFEAIFSGSSSDNVKMSYLKALIEQNWIIIRELDDLNKKLDNK